MSKELLKLALEAIERGVKDGYWNKDTVDAATRIQKYLAEQPAHQWQSTADKCELEKVPANGSLLPAQQEPGRNHYEDGDVFERIAAMKRRTAQQEPVKHALQCICGCSWEIDAGGNEELVSSPPPQRTWVGLTDEDLEAEFGFIDELLRDCCYRTEAKLKEKNT